MYTGVWAPGPGSVGLVSRPSFVDRFLRGSRCPAPAGGGRGPETAERGGRELGDGRQLVPQVFSEKVSWGLPLVSSFWLVAGDIFGAADAAR